MADHKCSKVHISAAIPPIMIAYIIFPRPRSLILILYSIMEFNMAAEIQDGCCNVIQFYAVAKKLSEVFPIRRSFLSTETLSSS